jgi:hypothetical protein
MNSKHSKDTNMKRIENHPAFYYLIGLVGIGLALAVTGCISNDPRTGSHEMERLVVIDGQYNTAHITFTLNKGDTEAKNEGGGTVAPKVDTKATVTP